MATNTYVALDKVTVGTATATVTFSSIPQGYTDLILVATPLCGTASNFTFQFNGDTATNYSATGVAGNGSSATSWRQISSTVPYLGSYASTDTTSSSNIISIMNYSNSTTYKSFLCRASNANTGVEGIVGLWRSTAAITSIVVKFTGGADFNVGSTFSLYGIRAEGVSPAPKATGGAIYSDSTYYYHVFGGSGTFTPTQSITADVLVVAGGGAGGGQNGGGGGAGGLLTFTSQSLTATGYTCTVGAGGTGGYPGGATSGTNSQFASLTASVGGGFGGCFTGGLTQVAASGGSGGGAHGNASNNFTGGSGTSGQGFAGGNTVGSINTYAGGGGGGAAAVGSNVATSEVGGAGGIGATSSLINAIGVATGVGQLSSGNYYIAGGGGGAGNVTQGVGGLGGGGESSGVANTGVGTAGTSNTGGGGGASRGGVAGGRGGSGVVIVRYAK